MNFALLLAALSAVESGGNPDAVGKHGEVSEFQMMPMVWRENKAARFCSPKDRACALVAASKHLHWITTRERSAQEIAAIWNYGFARCEKKKFQFHRYPLSVRNHATRVANVYWQLVKSHNAAVATQFQAKTKMKHQHTK